MNIDERLEILLKTTQEHTRQLELDGLHIRQLAKLAEGSREDMTRMTNAMEALIELNANHETRIQRVEDGGQATS